MSRPSPLLLALVLVVGCGDDAASGADAAVTLDAAGMPDGAAPDGPVAVDAGGDADASWAVVAITEVPFDAPEGTADQSSLELITSAADFMSRFGVAAPGAIDFASEWALFYSAGARPMPGHVASITAVDASSGGDLRAQTLLRVPNNGCLTLQYAPAVTALVKMPAQASAPSSVTQWHADADVDCAATGQTQDSTCTPTMLCGPDLICAGLTRGDTGWCRPDWMHAVFAETHTLAIPDDDAGGLVRTLDASGLATVDQDVVVRVELDHPDPSELLITITNPSNNQVTVWDHEAAAGGRTVIHRAPVGFSGDESVNGTWTLTIIDNSATDTGDLLRWSVEITSRFD